MHLFNWPNSISLARLLSVPLIICLILSHQMVIGFWVFLIASISDAADGYLARHLKARTELGSFLDPIADKALLIGVYLVLGIAGYISPILVTLVIFRDVMIIGGTLLLFVFEKNIHMNPLSISKINTVVQILFVSWILFEHAFGIHLPSIFIVLFEYIVGLTTLLSGAFYVRLWCQRMTG